MGRLSLEIKRRRNNLKINRQIVWVEVVSIESESNWRVSQNLCVCVHETLSSLSKHNGGKN
jgi:hypothetical protein